MQLRDEFHAECARAIALVNQVENALTPQGQRIPPLQRNLVFETAFLRVLLGWESFLEAIFLHYLCGRAGASGNSYTPLVSLRSIDLASRVITSDRDYLTWTSSAVIKDRAELWLGSKARVASGLGKASDLKDMYRIRNRIAHSSAKSKEEFADARARQVPNRAHYRGFGPGMVLRHERANGIRNLNRFVDQLKNAATEIAIGP